MDARAELSFSQLLQQVQCCTLCQPHLPLPAKPILQMAPQARLLIAGQAPGRKAHDSGRPFTDASGARLRDWLGLSEAEFYDPAKVAILPMGFCYPGTGPHGDLPPRPECAAKWRQALLARLPAVKLTLVLGQYAQAYHLPVLPGASPSAWSVTQTVQQWRQYGPALVPLPHPSPRNQRWLVQNPWFASDLLPLLRQQIRQILAEPAR